MQRILTLAVLLSVVFIFGTASGVSIIKWSQMPDLDAYAHQSQWDYTDWSPPIARADDWLCVDGLPVNSITWWGSNFADRTGVIEGFAIKIFENDTSGPFNKPGTEVYNEFFQIADVNQSVFGSDKFGDTVFKYQVDLDKLFQQTKDNTYWLSIIAVTPNAAPPIWGWSESITENLSNSVVGTLVDSGVPQKPEVNICSWVREQHDLAFEIGVVPEPGTIAMIASGIFGLFYYMRRKKD